MAEDPLIKVARAFLRKGDTGTTEKHELAAACEQLVQKTAQRSLKAASKLAWQFVQRSAGDKGVLALTAYRVLARITHMRGVHAGALVAYLEARKLAGRDAMTRARIDRALVDVYMYLGNHEKSRQAAKRAIATFRKQKSESDLAQTEVNYANLLHRQDRHREAERLYHKTADFFEKQGNRIAAARCYYNRANTLVQLFDLPEADKLYTEAAAIYDSEGFDLDANDAHYGLAWSQMLKGELHTALLALAECEEKYRTGGDPRGEALCTLDRAEVYLTLGLYSDARDNARLAERRFRKLRLRYETSKASLFRAQAAFGLGVRSEARSTLKRARAGFSDERNVGFLGVADLLAADLERDEKKRGKLLEAARKSFAGSQMPLWSAVCDLRQVGLDGKSTNAFKRLNDNAAVRHVPHLYAMWQTAQGDRSFQQGDKLAARRHWRQAADRLDAVRAQLPPVELRTAYARRDSSPHRRLIDIELERDPMLAAGWLERYRTAGIWAALPHSAESSPERKRVAASLEALARHVAATSLRISGHAGERGIARSVADSRATRIQKQVLHQFIDLERKLKADADPTERIVNDLQSVSRRLPVIQFHLRDDDIIAFRHYRGDTLVHRYTGARNRLNQCLRRWRFILEGELLADHLNQPGNTDLEKYLWSELGDWLWSPLEVDSDCREVLVIPEGELANLPLQALTIDGQILGERHQFVTAPSLRHYLAAIRTKPRSSDLHFFRGSASDLPSVSREMEHLSALEDKNLITHAPCGREDWLDTQDSWLWHFSGHAVLRADNPFYSYVVLDDGPLFAADFRLKNRNVNLVTLASCRTGEQVALPGEESTGLVRSLLEMGARNVVASYWPTADQTTALWTKTFYDSIFAGSQILAAARAAADTVRAVKPSAYHWAAFAVFGAGDLGEGYAN